MKRLVIDTDPGVDDARALMLAFAYPTARVEALTTVAGNVGVEQTTANACTILDVLAISSAATPVFRGAASALLGTDYDGAYFHGTDGLGNTHFPRSPRRVENEHAALALLRLANEYPNELALVAIGPLTNVALALRLDPTLPQKFQRLVVMGGTIRGTGNNRRNPTAEFNAFTDPEAAAIVLNEWRGLWLLSWETTLAHMLPPERVELMMKVQTPRGEFWRRISAHSLEYTLERFGRPGMNMPDELALAVALEPEIVTHSELRWMGVELSGALTRGQTVVDWAGNTGREPNVNIVLEINRERFWELLRASVEEKIKD